MHQHLGTTLIDNEPSDLVGSEVNKFGIIHKVRTLYGEERGSRQKRTTIVFTPSFYYLKA